MSDFRFEKIKNAFERCFRDAGLFERDVSGGSLIETDILRKEGKKWLVVAAGINQDEAAIFFPAQPKRAERAGTPLTITGGGDISFLFVVRPVSFPIQKHLPLTFIAHFAPGDDVPLVEMRSGYLRIGNLSDNNVGLTALRWDLDAVPSHRYPMEDWLRNWPTMLNHNPAHAPSHLHINSPQVSAEPGSDLRDMSSPRNLRLGMGVPNPLSLILSLASWLRAI